MCSTHARLVSGVPCIMRACFPYKVGRSPICSTELYHRTGVLAFKFPEQFYYLQFYRRYGKYLAWVPCVVSKLGVFDAHLCRRIVFFNFSHGWQSPFKLWLNFFAHQFFMFNAEIVKLLKRKKVKHLLVWRFIYNNMYEKYEAKNGREMIPNQ